MIHDSLSIWEEKEWSKWLIAEFCLSLAEGLSAEESGSFPLMFHAAVTRCETEVRCALWASQTTSSMC